MSPTIRRLVLVVEGGRQRAEEDPQLREIIRLASRLDLQLLALFVESRDLLRCAALPFTRQLGATSARIQELRPEQVRRQLTRQAERFHALLAELARLEGVPLSFQVERGAPEDIARTTSESDLLAVGLRSPPLAEREASTKLPAHVGACLMLAGPVSGPVTVLFDPSPAGSRCLALGVRIARHLNSNCRVLWMGPDEIDVTHRTRVEQLRPQLGRQDLVLETLTPQEDLISRVRGLRGGLLVAPASLANSLSNDPSVRHVSLLAVR